jgi:hypothetical protein
MDIDVIPPPPPLESLSSYSETESESPPLLPLVRDFTLDVPPLLQSPDDYYMGRRGIVPVICLVTTLTVAIFIISASIGLIKLS